MYYNYRTIKITITIIFLNSTVKCLDLSAMFSAKPLKIIPWANLVNKTH